MTKGIRFAPERPPLTAKHRWVRCKGCGGAIVLFTDGTGRVGHSKPLAMVGIPNGVPCALFRRSNTEQLWALHKDAEPIEPPESFEPLNG